MRKALCLTLGALIGLLVVRYCVMLPKPTEGGVILGCGIIVTNNMEFAFGGWPLETPEIVFTNGNYFLWHRANGTYVWSESAQAYVKEIRRSPVYRVKMTVEENEMLVNLIRRAKKDQ